ncbi:MAG: serine hydrolase domain-containing protein [Collimonas pratensis]|uniref:serine hydrolase domain-containing protein n=1 Tax=Collimonas pratensis TaxID=279113 RepID=UPI003C771BAB
MRRLTVMLLSNLAASLALAAPTPPAGEAEQQAQLDQDIPQLLEQDAIPSVSIAQIRNGKVVLFAAYGEQSDGVPATPATLYNAASLTKPLTAEIILRLVSKGEIELDEPMDRYWLDPDIAADPRHALLTPRLALSHRTGFPNWRDGKEGLRILRQPGVKWGYSGEGYRYVAHFAENKSGQDFEELAQTYLFKPLAMTETSYSSKDWFKGRIAVPANAAGEAVQPQFASRFNAADLLYTTAYDYGLFIAGVLADQGLSPAVARERGKIQVSMMDEMCQGKLAESCPPNAGFGLGWQILAFKDETLLMHTGKDEGVFTFAYLNRTSRDGAVILTNSDNGYKIVLPVLERLNSSPAFLRYLRGQIQ